MYNLELFTIDQELTTTDHEDRPTETANEEEEEQEEEEDEWKKSMRQFKTKLNGVAHGLSELSTSTSGTLKVGSSNQSDNQPAISKATSQRCVIGKSSSKIVQAAAAAKNVSKSAVGGKETHVNLKDGKLLEVVGRCVFTCTNHRASSKVTSQRRVIGKRSSKSVHAAAAKNVSKSLVSGKETDVNEKHSKRFEVAGRCTVPYTKSLTRVVLLLTRHDTSCKSHVVQGNPHAII